LDRKKEIENHSPLLLTAEGFRACCAGKEEKERGREREKVNRVSRTRKILSLLETARPLSIFLLQSKTKFCPQLSNKFLYLSFCVKKQNKI